MLSPVFRAAGEARGIQQVRRCQRPFDLLLRSPDHPRLPLVLVWLEACPAVPVDLPALLRSFHARALGHGHGITGNVLDRSKSWEPEWPSAKPEEKGIHEISRSPR